MRGRGWLQCKAGFGPEVGDFSDEGDHVGAGVFGLFDGCLPGGDVVGGPEVFEAGPEGLLVFFFFWGFDEGIGVNFADLELVHELLYIVSLAMHSRSIL